MLVDNFEDAHNMLRSELPQQLHQEVDSFSLSFSKGPLNRRKQRLAFLYKRNPDGSSWEGETAIVFVLIIFCSAESRPGNPDYKCALGTSASGCECRHWWYPF